MDRLTLMDDNVVSDCETNSILTDKLIAQFVKFIERGLPADGVCDYLGIANTTFWSWMRKGEKFILGAGEPKKFRLYGKFVKAFRRATAAYRLGLIEHLHRQGNINWTRPMAILERRDRGNFSRMEVAGGSDESFDQLRLAR